MIDLGDLARVWTGPAFLAAFAVGAVFGYFVIGRVIRLPRWHTENSARSYGWLVGVLAAWWISALVLSQVLAALLTGDFLWERILSRLGPYLLGSIGTGLGTWAAVRPHRK